MAFPDFRGIMQDMVNTIRYVEHKRFAKLYDRKATVCFSRFMQTV